jgi:hydroxypyruvate isomerase
MSRIAQSVAWWCFVPRRMTPEAFVRAAAEAGYAAIDLVPQQYWRLVADHGLAIASIEGHRSIAVGLNRADQHERIEQELRASLELAREWRIPNIVCFSGNRDGLDDAAGAAMTVAAFARVAPAAEAAGVTLLLELLNSKVDHPGYQADRSAWGVDVCQRVGSPCVKLLYDIYHMQIMEGDIIRTLQRHCAVIGHYHTAGNPGRHEIDVTQEINYPAVLRAIAATGYAGYVGHEFLPAGDPAAALRETFAQCAACL